MMDSVFMQPTPRSTVMEFFPRGTYVRDHETIVQSVGLKYMAWWDKEYDLDSHILQLHLIVSFSITGH
jgi:hypothetical protein